MASFACALLLIFVIFMNVLRSENKRIENETGIIQTKQAERNQIILQYQSVIEKRSKINRGIKNIEEFWNKRNKLADSEVKQLFGNSLPLNEDELEVNKIILSKKYGEHDKALDPNDIFPPSVHFFKAKQLIEESEIFEIIKKIPKGANIYGSFLTSLDFDFMYQLTFDDNLYFRFDNDILHLEYSKTKPNPGWRSLAHLRNTTDNPKYIEDLNNAIKESLTMIISNPWKRDHITSLKKFNDIIDIHLSLIKYKPNFMKALRRVLDNLYEDNIMYAELYFSFPELYDLDGKTYNALSVLRLSKVVIDDFIRTNNDFIGLRFIYIQYYNLNLENVDDFRETAVELWKTNPNLISGFGIKTDQEPLSDLIEELLKFPKEMKLFLDTSFYSDWGFDSDYNMLDALVLPVASLGEAIAINKHPFVLEKLRKQGIPIKVCPILVQTLNYIRDIRNHPLNLLVASNYPLVVGSIGGGFANATGLSYDWYEFYMAMTPKFCDLRCLKQLAINSWIYSSLSVEDKKRSILAWEEKWDQFIEDFINDSDLKN